MRWNNLMLNVNNFNKSFLISQLILVVKCYFVCLYYINYILKNNQEKNLKFWERFLPLYYDQTEKETRNSS